MAHLYRAFGAWLESAIELPWLAGAAQPAGFAAADLRVLANAAASPFLARPDLEPVYCSQWTMPNGEPFVTVYRLIECDVLRFYDGLRFAVCDETIDIDLQDAAQAHQAQIWLLGPVMAYWLERRGALALHASAVVVDGVAVAFTANSRGGKSTLAASFVQAGADLLADDILPLRVEGMRVVAQPGFPSMRLWPAEAERFIGRVDDLDLVHPAIDKRRADVGEGVFGRFHAAPAPLTCIYIPERREAEAGPPRIEITPLSRAAALTEMARMSFVARLMQVLQPQPARFDMLAQLARAVPVKRLSYPSGYAFLAQVREAVLADTRHSLASELPMNCQ